MNEFLKTMKQDTNYALTENGAITRKSTLNKTLDLFALGGAFRSRSEIDCINLFLDAFNEDQTLALKCLFYLRDVRGGQGERRFFRVVLKYLAKNYPDAVLRNLELIPEYGRWDDLYVLDGTPLEKEMYHMLYHQLVLDATCQTPSLLAKWLKSENTSSAQSCYLGMKTRKAFSMTARQYRRLLSKLRARIRVVERLMSENRWDEIEFDKIPSRAGIIYRNAFARRDIIKEKYAKFASSKETKVNAEVLYPHDIAHRAFTTKLPLDSPERQMLQKYWDNLPDYYKGRKENGIAVVDVSGSMYGTPMEAAVSMGAYIADKAHGPFAHHFITFSNTPELVEFSGVDIVDKLKRCTSADWGMSTNLEGVFDLLLNTALKSKAAASDMPERIYIFSDMEFNACMSYGYDRNRYGHLMGHGLRNVGEIETLMERIKSKWAEYGYKLPSVVFWNLNARNNNIPAIGDGFSYVSGFSPVMVSTILSGKDGVSLMLEKLNSERYAAIK